MAEQEFPQSAFLMINAPHDKELLHHYVEAMLDVGVLNIDFLDKNVLITIDTEKDVREVKDLLKECEEDLDGRTGPLEIIDAQRDKSRIVVKNIDKKYLSLKWLQLYIESVFADGESVILDCKFIQNYEGMAYVTFKDDKVLSKVLKQEDHVPLNSVPGYHIYVRPYYHIYENYQQSPLIYQPNQERQPALEETKILDKNEEKETEYIRLSKGKWKFLKEKIMSLEKSENLSIQYKNEFLSITGREASKHKTNISVLLSDVKSNNIDLTEDLCNYLKDIKVNNLLKGISEDSAFSIKNKALSLYSLDDVELEKYSKKVKERVLYSESVILSSEITEVEDDIRKLVKSCKSEFLVVITWESSELNLTGIKDDVILAAEYLKKEVEGYKLLDVVLTFKDEEAVFVKRYWDDFIIKDVFRNRKAQTYEDLENKEFEIRVKVSCKDSDELKKDLDNFKRSIMKWKVPFEDFGKDDLHCIALTLKEDATFLKDFQRKHFCCIFQGEVTFSQFEVESTGKFNYNFGALQVRLSKDYNIIEASSELLVCGIDKSKDLSKARISKAFGDNDPTLQRDMSTFKFSQKGVCVITRKVKGNPKCQAIAFVILKKWPKVDIDLSEAVIEVLEKANEMGLQSVSIPPLGCGRHFRYPEDIVANAFITAIEQFLENHSGKVTLNCISLLAPERSLFSKMNESIDCALNKIGNNQESNKLSQAMGGEGTKKRIRDLKPSVIIVSRSNDKIVSRFVDDLKKCSLHVEYYEPESTFFWPQEFIEEVIAKARAMNVQANLRKGRGKFVFELKGNLNIVKEVKHKLDYFIQQQKSKLFSKLTPQRGTLKFIEHAAACAIQYPSYWKSAIDYTKHQLKSVSREYFDAINKLVLTSWEQGNVGKGSDAKNIGPNTTIKVTTVERLENFKLFHSYYQKRKAILFNKKTAGQICNDYGRKGKGLAFTMKNLPEIMNKEILSEINEHYLFHGFKSTSLTPICEQGLDPRLSSDNVMFGKGVYAAESSTKADQYADSKDQRLPNGSELKMFLLRVTMGDVFVCDHNHETVKVRDAKKLMRPPCRKCYKDTCDGCQEAGNFDSVLGDGKWLFREFVVYEPSQCYPEYLITYKRV